MAKPPKNGVGKVVFLTEIDLSISKGFHLILDIKLKSLKLFESASISLVTVISI